jgi:hypothetical protein
MDMAVAMTKSLWDFGIHPFPELSEAEVNDRVRDVLMAVRLRLARLKAPSVFVEVPVLLSLPPEPTPQVFPIYALFHKDPLDAECLLLIHPGEVFLVDKSSQQN